MRNKTPGNDGLAKNFCETFWSELKTLLWKVSNKLSILRPEVFHKDKLLSSSLRKKTGENEI